jgi:hypothetical protein
VSCSFKLAAKESMEISENQETEERTKVQALSLAKECVINKLDLLTNATVVEDAIRFVKKSNGKLTMSKEEDDNYRESKEPDDDQELERKQEKEESEEFATTTTTTTNQIF